MKRSAFSLLMAVAILAVCTLAVQAAPVNASGHWQVQVTNGADLNSGVVTFNQVGSTVVGKLKNTTISGTMASDTKMNAKWNGPKGAGWITLYFSANGKSFQGTWGYNGKKAAGDFIGKRTVSNMSHM
ncbi:MAG TPA: hypothetical protein VGW96_07630 [Candidatus Eremiobacteraceae bacterium]|nr:hypothetical protein [Candidatus Eremiobacteraceae bacterium]